MTTKKETRIIIPEITKDIIQLQDDGDAIQKGSIPTYIAPPPPSPPPAPAKTDDNDDE